VGEPGRVEHTPYLGGKVFPCLPDFKPGATVTKWFEPFPQAKFFGTSSNIGRVRYLGASAEDPIPDLDRHVRLIQNRYLKIIEANSGGAFARCPFFP
jgi:hypothetical protein